MLGYHQWGPKEQTAVKFSSKYKNIKYFFHKNASEYIICEMAVIFSIGHGVGLGLVWGDSG